VHPDIDICESGAFQPRFECARVDGDQRVAMVKPLHATAPAAIGAGEDAVFHRQIIPNPVLLLPG
jgi:hypothetical protein